MFPQVARRVAEHEYRFENAVTAQHAEIVATQQRQGGRHQGAVQARQDFECVGRSHPYRVRRNVPLWLLCVGFGVFDGFCYTLRSRTFVTEWSGPLESTNVARPRVGRMLSTRFGSLIDCHTSVAVAIAASSDNDEN